MSRLTEEQKRIAAHPSGPAIVIAVPGSGKTTALLGLINDLKARGQQPHRILAVTFTKAAADQMRPRLAMRTGAEWATAVDFRTLHSFAFKILVQAGISLQGRVVEEIGQHLRVIMQEAGLKALDATAVENMTTDLTRYIGTMRPSDFIPASCHSAQFQKVLARYTAYKDERGLFDMDDLIEQAVRQLEGSSALQAQWQRRYDWRLIDEHQDTSPLQWRLLQLVTPAGSPNLVVVGDDDQSIYAWRGSTNDSLLSFKRLFSDAVVYPLSLTHRCPVEILQPAAAMIAHNHARYPKLIRSEKVGGSIELLTPTEPSQELEIVVNRLKQWHRAGENMKRFAVLYRTNAQAFALVSRLEDAKIPYYQLGGSKDPFSRWMTRDILSYIRIACGQGNGEDLERIVRRPQREGLSSRDGALLLHRALKTAGTPLGALQWVAENGGFLERTTARDLWRKLQALRELKAAEAIRYVLAKLEYRRGLEVYCKWSGSDTREAEEYIQAIELLVAPDAPCSTYLDLAAKPAVKAPRSSEQVEGVCLSTMHSAKGLEWRSVFIIGAVDANHPRQLADSMPDEEEERRLFYVAMTRAKEELVISVPRKWGNETAKPSPFLVEAGLVGQPSAAGGQHKTWPQRLAGVLPT